MGVNNLKFRAARGIDQQTIEEPDFQISRSIVERVKNEGNPVLTVDAQKDDRFSQQLSIVTKGLRSILCVPLKSKEKLHWDHLCGQSTGIRAFSRPMILTC